MVLDSDYCAGLSELMYIRLVLDYGCCAGLSELIHIEMVLGHDCCSRFVSDDIHQNGPGLWLLCRLIRVDAHQNAPEVFFVQACQRKYASTWPCTFVVVRVGHSWYFLNKHFVLKRPTSSAPSTKIVDKQFTILLAIAINCTARDCCLIRQNLQCAL